MFSSALLLACALLSAAPATAAASPQEQQVRSVLMPPDGGSVEVFVRAFVEQNPYSSLTAVVLPGPIKQVDADADALVESDARGGDGWGNRLQVSSRRPVTTGRGVQVRITLVDEARVTLRLVTRPNVRDVVLNIRARPAISPEENERQAQERLLRPQSLGEIVSGKTRLIAERGSEAVINRAVGHGYLFKQTNLLSITFVDVVHDAGISYATLLIANCSDSDWPVDLERINLTGSASGMVRIISRASEFAVIPPGAESRVVLAYETPASDSELLATIDKPGTDLPSLLVTVLP
ncbi:DUF2381 family protein [Vitiosangium sp. GDMCC 1.1324]|uniref:DUF2381 family protein n=1 Tax=Vitiosangium sp. (strain GDMCC 1.1324) TaxID=2138576 RepID=UPI001E2FAE39|nr:DUF2381 family protein [Vitiosangium sp. GDMCC 1.1324]